MKAFVKILYCIVVVLAGCNDGEIEKPTEGVNLRIKNTSGYIFDGILVDSNGESQTYGKLYPGQYSGYKPFNLLYTYSYIEISVADKEYVLQPIDFFGESPLPEGNYTYDLTIDDADSKFGVSLEFRED